jgi:hypothetical protein
MPEENVFAAQCIGELLSTGRALHIRFIVTCSREGVVALAIDDIPLSNDTIWIHEAFNDHSPDSPTALSLSARDDHGRIVDSSSVYLTSCGTRSDEHGTWITLAAVAFRLEVREEKFDPAASAQDARVTYYAIGLRAFGAPRVDTPGARSASCRSSAGSTAGRYPSERQSRKIPDAAAFSSGARRPSPWCPMSGSARPGEPPTPASYGRGPRLTKIRLASRSRKNPASS